MARLLMERPTGTRSLCRLSLDGGDDRSHRHPLLGRRRAPPHHGNAAPAAFNRSKSLFATADRVRLGRPDRADRARLIAIELLASEHDRVVSCTATSSTHNVLDAGDDRWVAIDPKGQFGERAYDFVNLFRNPNDAIGNDPAVFSRRVAQIERIAETRSRAASPWIVAFCALCLVWDYYPEGSPEARSRCARWRLALDAANRERSSPRFPEFGSATPSGRDRSTTRPRTSSARSTTRSPCRHRRHRRTPS